MARYVLIDVRTGPDTESGTKVYEELVALLDKLRDSSDVDWYSIEATDHSEVK